MQIGTLSGNPVAAAAGLATLEILRRPGAYEQIFATGRELMSTLRQLLHEAGIPAQVMGEPPLFEVVFTADPIPITAACWHARGDIDTGAAVQCAAARARHPQGRAEILRLARPHRRRHPLHPRGLGLGDQDAGAVGGAGASSPARSAKIHAGTVRR